MKVIFSHKKTYQSHIGLEWADFTDVVIVEFIVEYMPNVNLRMKVSFYARTNSNSGVSNSF